MEAVDPEADAPAAGDLPVLQGVAWSVVSAENAGDVYDEEDNFRAIEANGGDLLAVVFSAENQGMEPVDLILGNYQDSIGEVFLMDEEGRKFAAVDGSFSSQCNYRTTAQPSIPLECAKVFEVPNGDGSYEALFVDVDDVEVGKVPVP